MTAPSWLLFDHDIAVEHLGVLGLKRDGARGDRVARLVQHAQHLIDEVAVHPIRRRAAIDHQPQLIPFRQLEVFAATVLHVVPPF